MKEEKNNYVVYKHITPDGMVYVGMTNDITRRWYETQYHHKPFVDWINQYGWDNIIHEVVYDGLYKEEAALIEDNLIEIHTSLGNSLNSNRSGRKSSDERKMSGLISDSYKMMQKVRKEYNRYICSKYTKTYYEKHPDKKEEFKDYRKKYLSTVEGKIYNRVASYNHRKNKQDKYDQIYETPAEAKQKYLDSGYIPSYIKNDDLI